MQVFKASNPELQMDNFEIMLLIIDEVKKFMANEKNKGFGGLKVIYCTPRSFSAEMVGKSLNECLAMKKEPKIGPYIAGKSNIEPLLSCVPPSHTHLNPLPTSQINF